MSKRPRWRRAGWWEDPPGDLEEPFWPLPGTAVPEPPGLDDEARAQRDTWTAAQAQRSRPSPGGRRDPVNEALKALENPPDTQRKRQ